jgi:hypothetical protein
MKISHTFRYQNNYLHNVILMSSVDVNCLLIEKNNNDMVTNTLLLHKSDTSTILGII